MATFTLRFVGDDQCGHASVSVAARDRSSVHLQRRQISSAAGASHAPNAILRFGVPLPATASAHAAWSDERVCFPLSSGGAHGIRPFAGLLPRRVNARLRAFGPTCLWLACFAPAVFVGVIAASCKEKERKRGGRSGSARTWLLGFVSRLRSASAGMKPAAAILPWALPLAGFPDARRHHDEMRIPTGTAPPRSSVSASRFRPPSAHGLGRFPSQPLDAPASDALTSLVCRACSPRRCACPSAC